MKISGPKSLDRQLRLWDEPLGNHGHVRHVIGDLIERMTVELLGGIRHKTQSNVDYCPDVSIDNGRWYFECKAAGRSRQTFIYEGRLAKDREFVKGRNLSYIIWHHKTDSSQASTVGQLQALVRRQMQCTYVVPFAVIDGLCQRRRCEKLNSAYGYHNSNPLYGKGYRLNLSQLEPWRFYEWQTNGTPND